MKLEIAIITSAIMLLLPAQSFAKDTAQELPKNLLLDKKPPIIANIEEFSKEVAVQLDSVPEKLQAGEKIVLTASVPKRGSAWTVRWEGARETETNFNEETGMIISRAEFTAEKAGMNQISFSIDMISGNSSTIHQGHAAATIDVTAAKSVVSGAEIRDVVFIPYRSVVAVSGYTAFGTVFILYSDGKAVEDSTITFNFPAGAAVVNVDVSFTVDGVDYQFSVPVQK